MSQQVVDVSDDILEYEQGNLQTGTNWWGAFVIGLAGTILVTGCAPAFLTVFGASYIPFIVFFTLSGVALCLLLAELSAMMPGRTGGSPSYAYPAYKDKWPRLAPHINGITAWMYWVGWMPVAPLNMILAASYIAYLCGLDVTAGITPVSTFIPWWTLAITAVGIMILSVPAYLGIRFGTTMATILAVLSMIPLTFLSVGFIFNMDAANWNELINFPHLDGTSFFAPMKDANGESHSAWIMYLAFAFPLLWTVIAFEAAACYIGECKNPGRDAKIAMTLEGGYGVFVYSMLPISFVVVLGAAALSDPNLVDPKTMFVTFASKIFPGVAGAVMEWAMGIMLIIALVLSALNSLMGCSRSLYQMSLDGQFPKFYQHLNKHHVPDRAMLTNVIASLGIAFMGGAIEIYSFSNVGYLGSFVPVLIGYYLLRRDRPNVKRPFRLPEYFKYIALMLAALYFFVWLFGGLIYSFIGGQGIYYILGVFATLLYLPLYWYRKHEDKRDGTVTA
ncbi:MAG: APC family permease [Methylobacillus sp.]|jgi:amino acid transporter|nr:APC family permease [Methylobacillus sp.]